MTAFTDLARDVDVMVVDTATGVHDAVLGFCGAASELVVVICDEPASFTDAYALIKLVSRERGVKRVQILCNRVRNKTHGRMLYARFLEVCERFLSVGLTYFGCVPEDSAFTQAARVRSPVVDAFPSSAAGVALKELAARADRWKVTRESAARPVFFADRLLQQVPVAPSVEAC